MSDAALRSYFVWLSRHPSEAAAVRDMPPEVASRLWADAWQAGAWDAIRRNTDLGLMLANIVERLEELYALYRDHDIEREAEQGSPLWSSEPEPETEYVEEVLPF